MARLLEEGLRSTIGCPNRRYDNRRARNYSLLCCIRVSAGLYPLNAAMPPTQRPSLQPPLINLDDHERPILRYVHKGRRGTSSCRLCWKEFDDMMSLVSCYIAGTLLHSYQYYIFHTMCLHTLMVDLLVVFARTKCAVAVIVWWWKELRSDSGACFCYRTCILAPYTQSTK